MAASYQDYTVSDPLDLDFLFVKPWLVQGHVHVYIKDSTGSLGFVETIEFTIAGVSENATVTLTGAAPTLNIGDTVRVARETPRETLVDFQSGTLRSQDLDTVTLQMVFIAQETDDALVNSLRLDGNSPAQWDAVSRRITFLDAPLVGSDAARYQDVLDVALGSGNLPPAPVNNGNFLFTSAASWVTGTPAASRTALELGTMATQTSGIAGKEFRDNDLQDLRYTQIQANLSDLDDVPDSRDNLGLSAAAVTDMGSAANEIVQLDGTARLPAVDGELLNLETHPRVKNSPFEILLQGGVNGTAGWGRTSGAAQTFGATLARIQLSASDVTALDSNAVIQLPGSGAANTQSTIALLAGTYEVTVMCTFENLSASGGPLTLSMASSPTGVAWAPIRSVTSTDGGFGNYTFVFTDYVVTTGEFFDWTVINTGPAITPELDHFQVHIKKIRS